MMSWGFGAHSDGVPLSLCIQALHDQRYVQNLLEDDLLGAKMAQKYPSSRTSTVLRQYWKGHALVDQCNLLADENRGERHNYQIATARDVHEYSQIDLCPEDNDVDDHVWPERARVGYSTSSTFTRLSLIYTGASLLCS